MISFSEYNWTLYYFCWKASIFWKLGFHSLSSLLFIWLIYYGFIYTSEKINVLWPYFIRTNLPLSHIMKVWRKSHRFVRLLECCNPCRNWRHWLTSEDGSWNCINACRVNNSGFGIKLSSSCTADWSSTTELLRLHILQQCVYLNSLVQ